MSGTTLFVIDMQPGYFASRDCVKQVLREIRLARRRDDGIVFVELEPSINRHTHQVLLDAARANGYERVAVTSKSGCDGSVELIETAHARGFTLDRVRVCGVNRGACVQETIRSLLYDATVVRRVEIGYSATAPGDPVWKRDFQYCRRHYQTFIIDGLVIKP